MILYDIFNRIYINMIILKSYIDKTGWDWHKNIHIENGMQTKSLKSESTNLQESKDYRTMEILMI